MTVHELRARLEDIDGDLEVYMEIDYYTNHDSWGQPSIKIANVDAVQTVYGGADIAVSSTPHYVILRNMLP